MEKNTSAGNLDTEISKLDAIAGRLPGVMIIHDIQGRVIWMSENGLRQLQITLAELLALDASEYYRRWFNEEDSNESVPKILGLLQRNNDEEVITYLQQVRINGDEKPTWHMSSTRIFRRDAAGQPAFTITLAIPIDAMHHMAAKAEKVLAENEFLRKNYKNYARLSIREREVLRDLTLGKTSAESAENLFISLSTVETHRKNLRKKLGTNSFYELSQYARSFDLI